MKKWIIGIVIVIAAIFCGVYFAGDSIFEKETANEVTEQVIEAADSQESDTNMLIEQLTPITYDSVEAVEAVADETVTDSVEVVKNDTLK